VWYGTVKIDPDFGLHGVVLHGVTQKSHLVYISRPLVGVIWGSHETCTHEANVVHSPKKYLLLLQHH
jgi:hypothetical protein